jgi:hypothetical protein
MLVPWEPSVTTFVASDCLLPYSPLQNVAESLNPSTVFTPGDGRGKIRSLPSSSTAPFARRVMPRMILRTNAVCRESPATKRAADPTGHLADDLALHAKPFKKSIFD